MVTLAGVRPLTVWVPECPRELLRAIRQELPFGCRVITDNHRKCSTEKPDAVFLATYLDTTRCREILTHFSQTGIPIYVFAAERFKCRGVEGLEIVEVADSGEMRQKLAERMRVTVAGREARP